MPANSFMGGNATRAYSTQSNHLVKLDGEENSKTLPWSRQIEVSGVMFYGRKKRIVDAEGSSGLFSGCTEHGQKLARQRPDKILASAGLNKGPLLRG